MRPHLKLIQTAKRIVTKKGGKPTFLIFNVTNRCQSKCITCFAWDYLNKNLDKELKIYEIEKIADIDLVSICTPNGLHAEMAINCLNSKKHVLCEKPLALNINDVDKIIHESYS